MATVRIRSFAGHARDRGNRCAKLYGRRAVHLRVEDAQQADHGAAGEGELTLFRCPMADDFGFDLWIQESNEIANPYMGQMMLECGTTATLE